MKSAEQFIKDEMELRIKLVESPLFMELCVKYVKQLGISAKEWNENKAEIALFLANQVIGKDNQEDGFIREFLTKS